MLSIDDRAEVQRLRRADRGVAARAGDSAEGAQYSARKRIPASGTSTRYTATSMVGSAVSGPGVPRWAGYKLMARMDCATACALGHCARLAALGRNTGGAPRIASGWQFGRGQSVQSVKDLPTLGEDPLVSGCCFVFVDWRTLPPPRRTVQTDSVQSVQPQPSGVSARRCAGCKGRPRRLAGGLTAPNDGG